MNRWRLTFKFFDTEKEAYDFCNRLWDESSYYVRKHYAAHYTPWESLDGKEHKFIVWYYTK